MSKKDEIEQDLANLMKTMSPKEVAEQLIKQGIEIPYDELVKKLIKTAIKYDIDIIEPLVSLSVEKGKLNVYIVYTQRFKLIVAANTRDEAKSAALHERESENSNDVEIINVGSTYYEGKPSILAQIK
jgi:hypothetical protein